MEKFSIMTLDGRMCCYYQSDFKCIYNGDKSMTEAKGRKKEKR
jgi:hypothetical protein